MDENIEIYGNSSSKTHTEREIFLLNCSSVVAFLSLLYEIGLMIYFLDQIDMHVVIRHISVMAVLISVAIWCRSFAGYKSSIKYREFNIGEYNMMKSISLVTGILCLVRVATLVFYFLLAGNFDPAYALYVGSEIILLLGMAGFFFHFYIDMKKEIKKIK